MMVCSKKGVRKMNTIEILLKERSGVNLNMACQALGISPPTYSIATEDPMKKPFSAADQSRRLMLCQAQDQDLANKTQAPCQIMDGGSGEIQKVQNRGIYYRVCNAVGLGKCLTA